MGLATYKTSIQMSLQMKGILPNTDELRKLLELLSSNSFKNPLRV